MLGKLNPFMVSLLPYLKFTDNQGQRVTGDDSMSVTATEGESGSVSASALALNTAMNEFDASGDLDRLKLAITNNDIARRLSASQISSLVLAISGEQIKETLSSALPQFLTEYDSSYAKSLSEANMLSAADAGRDNSETAGRWAAQAEVVNKDPLILDLNRDGKIDTSGTRFFDLDSNGTKEVVSWASGGDGLLVIDKNGNGKIDGGTEVFGDRYVMSDGRVAKSGFEALSDIDSNGDGVVNADDEGFSNLRLWVDLNGDGAYADGELVSLKTAGVESISLGSEVSGILDENGNEVISQGRFVWSDGAEGLVGEYGLQSSGRYTLDSAPVEVPEDIAALPDLHGRGALLSLRQAAAVDERDGGGELKGLVEAFSLETDPTARLEILDRILYSWAGSFEIDQESRGGNFDAQKLVFLERYWGYDFVGADGSPNPNTEAATALNDAYGYAKEQIYAELLAGSIYKDMTADSILIDDETGEIRLDISGALSGIYAVWAEDSELGKVQLKEYLTALDAVGLRDCLTSEDIHSISDMIYDVNPEFAEAFIEANSINISDESKDYDLRLVAFGGDDSLASGSGRDILLGGDGDDYLNGGGNDDSLVGGDGADKIYGEDGSDLIVGGRKDDLLVGGAGDDRYAWNVGDGRDLIQDNEGSDLIEIGEGVNPEKVKILREGDNLVFKMGDKAGGSLTWLDWYKDNAGHKAGVLFADGTSWSVDDIEAIAAGEKEAFSLASIAAEADKDVSRSAGEEELEEAISLLSAKRSLDLSSFGETDDIYGDSSSRATDWGSYSNWAGVMNEKRLETANDFAAEQFRLDMAVAALGFGTQTSEQVVSFTETNGQVSGQLGLASGNAWDYFKKDSNNGR
jgi:hypothetical protein